MTKHFRVIALLLVLAGTAFGQTKLDASRIKNLQGGFTLFYPGVPAASTQVIYAPSPYAFTVATNCVGSYLKAKTAATGSTVFTLYKNGVSFGTATFSGAGTSAAFVCSATSFVPGDVLEVIGGGDSTLANIGGVIAGTR